MKRACFVFLLTGAMAISLRAWQVPLTTPQNRVFRVGGGVSPPSVLTKRDPEYTEEARRERVSGTVLLSLVVSADGSPRDITVVRPLGYGLDQAAIACVNDWRFKPGRKDGLPVDVVATIEVNFRLLHDLPPPGATPGSMARVESMGIDASLPAPALLFPLQGVIFDSVPRITKLEWQASPGAASYLVEWDFKTAQGWSAEMNQRLNIPSSTETTTWTIDFVGAQPGRWRVWPVNKNGQRGNPSEWRTFRYSR